MYVEVVLENVKSYLKKVCVMVQIFLTTCKIAISYDPVCYKKCLFSGNRWYKFFFKVLGDNFLMVLLSMEGLKLRDI